MTPRNPADRPVTEPRTLADLDRLAAPLHARVITREAIEELTRLAYEKGRAEAAQGAAPRAEGPHPLLVKYGLEGMAGDPIEVLHRHLTNNHAATVGGYKLALERAKERMEAAEGAAPRAEGRTPEDDADCERYGCEDRTHPIHRAAPLDVDRLTAIIESRMSRDLAWLADDGKTVNRLGPEQVAHALMHLHRTGDVVSGLPPLEGAGFDPLCPVDHDPRPEGAAPLAEGLLEAATALADATAAEHADCTSDHCHWCPLVDAVRAASRPSDERVPESEEPR